MPGYNEGLRKMQPIISPSQTYRIDHYQMEGQGCLSRIVIEERNGLFCVKHWEVVCEPFLGNLRELRNIKYNCMLHASEKVEEIVTCLELEGWENTSESDFVLYDVRNHIGDISKFRLSATRVFDFQREYKESEFCYVRPMISGVHAIATLNSNDTVSVKTLRGGTESIDLDNFTSLQSFGRIDGARGFAAEGIWTGVQFFVTDVLYLHDNWLTEIPFSDRDAVFRAYLNKHDLRHINTIGLRSVRVAALDALFGQITKGFITYENDFTRKALSKWHPNTVSFGAKKHDRFEVFDDDFKYIGLFKGIGNANLAYREFYSLDVSNNHHGIDMLLI